MEIRLKCGLMIADRLGKGRIIDVSRAAAKVLGMVGSGITTVRVEWLPDSEKSNELNVQENIRQD